MTVKNRFETIIAQMTPAENVEALSERLQGVISDLSSEMGAPMPVLTFHARDRLLGVRNVDNEACYFFTLPEGADYIVDLGQMYVDGEKMLEDTHWEQAGQWAKKPNLLQNRDATSGVSLLQEIFDHHSHYLRVHAEGL